jgi:hypothetical protein
MLGHAYSSYQLPGPLGPGIHYHTGAQNLMSTQTPIAGYGRYNQITIVRVDDSAGDHFYMLVDYNSRQVGQTYQYLRNARKQAARLVRAGFAS